MGSVQVILIDDNNTEQDCLFGDTCQTICNDRRACFALKCLKTSHRKLWRLRFTIRYKFLDDPYHLFYKTQVDSFEFSVKSKKTKASTRERCQEIALSVRSNLQLKLVRPKLITIKPSYAYNYCETEIWLKGNGFISTKYTRILLGGQEVNALIVKEDFISFIAPARLDLKEITQITVAVKNISKTQRMKSLEDEAEEHTSAGNKSLAKQLDKEKEDGIISFSSSNCCILTYFPSNYGLSEIMEICKEGENMATTEEDRRNDGII